jgi:hypothetical protein
MKQIDLFIELAKPNIDGSSRKVFASEFIGKYRKLRSGNGYKWPEGLSGQYKFARGGRGDNWWIQLTGKCELVLTRKIRKDITEQILSKMCEHTGYDNLSSDRLEVDHRNGRYNDFRVLNEETQNIEDFICLSRRANLQKRSDCSNCKKTGLRFDAKKLGYKIGWTHGDEKHNGSIDGCVGCYWFGPLDFKKAI